MGIYNQTAMAIVASAVFALDGVALAGCWLESHKAEKRVEEGHRVIEQLQNIETSTQKLGSYAHRYVINGGDAAFLREYHAAEDGTESLLHTMRTLFVGRPAQRNQLLGLQLLIGERDQWERKLIAAYEQKDATKLADMSKSSTGAVLMDKIRAQLKDMEDTENVLLKKQVDAYETYKSLCLTAVAILTVVGGLSLQQAIKKSNLSRQLEAQQELAYERLELLNKGLNTQVADLLRAQDQANKAISARAEFLARVSHDLRTPLTAIIGATELALAESTDKSQRALIDIVHQSGHHLLGLVNDILDFENLELQEFRLEPAAFDLRILILSAVQPLRMKAEERGITFDLDVARDLPFLVYGDRLRIQQVLVNLVDNANKFTKSGSISVHVTLDRITGDQAIVRFTVTDTGIGIRREELANIFAPSVYSNESPTTAAAAQAAGTAKGLSIAKKLVELLDGRMEASSEPGLGSKFTFAIPLVLSAPTISAKAEVTPALLSRSGDGKILVVDDNPIVRMVTQAQLERLGFEVELVGNGDEAIELTRQQRFMLVLMDIQMPGLDGFGATRIIRAMTDNLCRDVPIVAYSAHSMPDEWEKFALAGINDYIAKPITLAALKEVIGKWTLAPTAKLSAPGREA
jgi:signal transduction histidine kinase/ActR/RegA family two-component response regulator